jgi:hypothetical protein
MKKSFVLLFLYLSCQAIFAQSDSTLRYKKKIKTLAITSAIGYVGAYATLGYFWYSNQTTSNFHFFNDNQEWMQMDKFGHALGAFAISETAVQTLRNIGMERKKAILIGSLSGLVIQTPIEILDGFSQNYGASWGDEIANFTGSGLVLTQYLLWDEIRIQPKFMYHHTNFPNNTPNKGLLGNGWGDYWLKDYNGQTYWLSFDIHKFLHKGNQFPKWLNLAIGTGASNMLRAEKEANIALGLKPYRRYFISLDINLGSIKTKSKFMNTVFKTINYIRIPLPTLEYNSNNGFGGHWLY